MTNINDTFISRLKTPKGAPAKYFDDKLSGFGVCIGKKGQISFIIDYKLSIFIPETGERAFKRYRKTFASWDKVSPDHTLNRLNADMAREIAIEYLKLARLNKDPFQKNAPQSIKIETVSELLDVYLAKHVEVHCQKVTYENMQRRIRVHIKPRLGMIPLSELRAMHIEHFHNELSKKVPRKSKQTLGGITAANHCLADLKAALTKAVEWEVLLVNPASKIKKFKQHARKRFLDSSEMRRLFETMHDLEKDETWAYKYRDCNDAVRLALFTGCRKGELLATKWRNVNLETTPPVWMKPHETTKQDEWEIVPLSLECVEVLKQRKIHNEKRNTPSEFVFPVLGMPEMHIQELKHSWTTLRRKAGIKDFTFHDLRHTFASHMAIQGKSLYVIGKMLGHKNTQTTQRYAKLNTGALEDLANSMSAVVQAAVQVAVPVNDNKIDQQKERKSA